MECFHFHTLRRPRFLREAFLVSVLISLIVSQLLCARAYVCVCVCVCVRTSFQFHLTCAADTVRFL